jgi:hypothetical protein
MIESGPLLPGVTEMPTPAQPTEINVEFFGKNSAYRGLRDIGVGRGGMAEFALAPAPADVAFGAHTVSSFPQV